MEVRTEPVLTPPPWHKSVLLASPVRLHHPHKDRLGVAYLCQQKSFM